MADLAAPPRHGPLAQRLVQGTHNPLVPGSNPGGPTKSPRFPATRRLSLSSLSYMDSSRIPSRLSDLLDCKQYEFELILAKEGIRS